MLLHGELGNGGDGVIVTVLAQTLVLEVHYRHGVTSHAVRRREEEGEGGREGGMGGGREGEGRRGRAIVSECRCKLPKYVQTMASTSHLQC